MVLLNDASAATTREARRLFENPNNSNSSGDGSNSGPSESTSPNSSEQNNNHDEDGEALDDHEDNDDDDDEQEEYVDNMPLATLAMKKVKYFKDLIKNNYIILLCTNTCLFIVV